jgi:SulP family sulfate permease
MPSIPILHWLPHYPKKYLSGDISAGLTVGVMLVPQGMAYAGIAGLPPVYGLYAALIPQVIYAILGTSRHLAVGPVAMDSLLVAAGVSAIATVGTERYLALAFLLAFLIGVIQLTFGLLKMGFLVNFLSRPVISGFTSGAAVIIALSQLKHLTGIPLPSSNHIQAVFYELWTNFQSLHWLTLSVGVLGIVVLKNIKKVHQQLPGALAVVILGVLIVYLGNLAQYGVKIVGHVPQGLPHFQAPILYLADIKALLPTALALALIAFLEAISVAKAIQVRHKNYKLDANQELIALGSANLIGSLFQCYPTTGGFSRTAVNDKAGAKTNLAALVSASLVGLTLLFLTPLFYYLPQSILAAIIIVAVLNLIDVQYPVFLWDNQRTEFCLLMLTFVITLTVGIQEGILSGVFFSLLVMIYKTMHPHIAVLGRIPQTDTFRNIMRFPECEVRKDVLIVRYDADIYFANANHFRESMEELVAEKGKGLKLLILNAESINHLDSTAVYTLEELYADLKAKGVQLYLTGLKGPLRDILQRVDFIDRLGEGAFYIDEEHALAHYDDEVSQAEKLKLQAIALQTNED